MWTVARTHRKAYSNEFDGDSDGNGDFCDVGRIVDDDDVVVGVDSTCVDTAADDGGFGVRHMYCDGGTAMICTILRSAVQPLVERCTGDFVRCSSTN